MNILFDHIGIYVLKMYVAGDESDIVSSCIRLDKNKSYNLILFNVVLAGMHSNMKELNL